MLGHSILVSILIWFSFGLIKPTERSFNINTNITDQDGGANYHWKPSTSVEDNWWARGLDVGIRGRGIKAASPPKFSEDNWSARGLDVGIRGRGDVVSKGCDPPPACLRQPWQNGMQSSTGDPGLRFAGRRLHLPYLSKGLLCCLVEPHLQSDRQLILGKHLWGSCVSMKRFGRELGPYCFF